jgi:hypothetical protein
MSLMALLDEFQTILQKRRRLLLSHFQLPSMVKKKMLVLPSGHVAK